MIRQGTLSERWALGVIYVLVYLYTQIAEGIMVKSKQRLSQGHVSRPVAGKPVIQIERVQTGIRIEKRLLKVLKGLAEYKDMTLGDLLEGIILHAFDGKHPFSEETRRRIAALKEIYKLDLDASASHRLLEKLDDLKVSQARKKRKGDR